MPSGYTSDIYEGKNPSLRRFMLTCVRGMGAFVLERDSSWDKELPQQYEIGSYYVSHAEECRAKLAKLRAMTLSSASWKSHECNPK